MSRKKWLQSGVRSCVLPGLPKHVVQDLDVGTVHVLTYVHTLRVRFTGTVRTVQSMTASERARRHGLASTKNFMHERIMLF